MRILVAGSGGREHALAWRLAQDGPDREVHVAPGNAGLGAPFTVHGDATNLEALALALRPDLVVVGPEALLAQGLADRLRDHGLAVLGPSAAAARLETSKLFAKEVMAACGVPAADHRVVQHAAELATAVDGTHTVLKVDGLAAGKGVVVAATPEEARQAGLELLTRFGGPLLVEERLPGREVSVLGLCDGERVVLLPSAQDHKRLHDGDRGPNTGGMGAISPGTHHGRLGMEEPELLHRVRETVLRPVLAELRRRGTPFLGILYAGLMVNPQDGSWRVLEFNVRAGDPETQAMVFRVQGDLGAAFLAAARGHVEEDALAVGPGAAACVVLAAAGYPGAPRRGDAIQGLPGEDSGVRVFHAGTARDPDGTLRTAGGRVLAVAAAGTTVAHALDRAYGACSRVRWPGVHYRRDLGRLAG